MNKIAPYVAMFVVLFAIWLNGYNGRKELRDAAVKGCERATLDRLSQAKGWDAARLARASAAAVETGVARARDLQAAETYKTIADGLRDRVVDCKATYDPPSINPFH